MNIENYMQEGKIFETLFDIIPFGVYVADVDSNEIVYINSFFRDSISDIKRKKCYELIYGLDEPCSFCRNSEMLDSSNKPNGNSIVFEHFNDLNDKWYQLQEKCISWPNGKVVKYSIAVDITEQKRFQNDLAEAHARLAIQAKELEEKNRAQEELIIQQGKLATIGEMMGAISHQWKQPITIIELIVANIEDSVHEGDINDDSILDNLDQISTQSKFLLKTMLDFLAFIRPNSPKAPFTIKDPIDEAYALIKKQFYENSIEFELNGEFNIVLDGYKNEFMHVILNLLSNGKDAFVGKSIENAKIEVKAQVIEAKEIVIYVCDNAGGVSEELLPNKLFEPYITTKGKKGTGIGLNIVKTIITQKFNGKIDVCNQNGGATFTIKLPLK